MKNNPFLRTWFLPRAFVLFLSLFVQNTFAQRDTIPLPNAETIINKKCNSSAEIVLALGFKTGKVAHIYLLMDEKDFTQPYLKNFFICISRGFANLAILNITAKSDRKELDFEINGFLHPPPSDTDPPKNIDTTKPPNHYRAYYWRISFIGERVRENLEYSPDAGNWRMVTYKFRKPSIYKPIYSGNVNSDLVVAVFKGDIRKVRSLLAKRANVNYRDDSGDSVLMLAVNLGKPLQMIRLLLDAGADVNAINNKDSGRKDKTALLYAAGYGDNTNVMRLLLKRGADINAQDEDGMTALMWEANLDGINEVKLLLEKKADINIKDKYGRTALQIALNRGRKEIADLLIAYQEKSKTK
jgi:hypothetical protein